MIATGFFDVLHTAIVWPMQAGWAWHLRPFPSDSKFSRAVALEIIWNARIPVTDDIWTAGRTVIVDNLSTSPGFLVIGDNFSAGGIWLIKYAWIDQTIQKAHFMVMSPL